MNARRVVKLSNIICLVSVLLLVYWVFTFIIMQVFGLKVFKENITQTFYFSILAIIALMTGALITNIVFNLTRIAEKHNSDTNTITKNGKVSVILFILSFPLIVTLLFVGNHLTSKKKENILRQSAESIIQNNKALVDDISNYSFTKDWITKTHEKLQLLSKIDINYRNVTLITKDEIGGTPVYLEFGNYYGKVDNDIQKTEYILKTDKEIRTYLEEVFSSKGMEVHFQSMDGEYELFYPIRKGETVIILHFKDNQRYGKIGS